MVRRCNSLSGAQRPNRGGTTRPSITKNAGILGSFGGTADAKAFERQRRFP